MRVLIHTATDPQPVAAALRADKACEVDIATDGEACLKGLAHAEALVIGNALYRKMADAIVAAPKLRWIQAASAGYEAMLERQPPPRVRLSRATGVWAPVVAEHALALILASIRGIPELERARRARRWLAKAPPSLGSLANAKLLIIGYGEIGQACASRAKAFGATITAVARRARQQEQTGVRGPEALPGLLAEADIVVVCADANAGKPILGPAEFSVMRPATWLVNVGRGALVDEAALVSALRERRIRGAALDVFAEEPLPGTSELWSMRNVIISPHIAGLGDASALQRLASLCLENVSALESNEELRGAIRL